MVAIKALACELPTKADKPQPLARWQCPDLVRAAVEQGIATSISGTTFWRWLSADAIKPWQHRSWIFPLDPEFGPKAARVLDLYARRFHHTPAPRQPTRLETEYFRGGSHAYLAAWDVHRARVFGRCEQSYFFVVQRKVVSPNDFHTLDEVEARLLDFQNTTNRSPHRSNGSSPKTI